MQPRRPNPPTAGQVGRVYNAGSMPSGVPGWYAVRPVAPSGVPIEGESMGHTPDTSRQLVYYVLGPGTPAVGDDLIGHLTPDGYWLAERSGGGGGGCSRSSCVSVYDGSSNAVVGATVTWTGPLTATGTTGSTGLACSSTALTSGTYAVTASSGTPAPETIVIGGVPCTVTDPDCPCSSTSTTLQMSSSKPTSNFGIFQSATFTYGPTPSWASTLALGSDSYLSTTWIQDPFLGPPVGAQPPNYNHFIYYLGCIPGNYILTRIYESSDYGSPFRDLVRQRWLVGLPGNTCSPFLMSNGVMFPGGDPTCIVRISQ